MSPFKSKAQFDKFLQLEREGKLKTGTTRKWLKETKNFKRLPKRKKNDNS